MSSGSSTGEHPRATQFRVIVVGIVQNDQCEYLICRNDLVLASEFSEYARVKRGALTNYDLNSATLKTFQQVGLISK